MFWNSRRLLFSKTFYYGIFEDFSFRMFWNIPRLLFLHILFLFRTFLSTEQQKYCYLQPSSLHFLITTKSKQNAVSRYKHSFIDASDEFHNVRARRTLLEGSFLTSCFILSLSLSVCGFCFDLQRSAIEKWLVIDFFYILFYKNVLRTFLCYFILSLSVFCVALQRSIIENGRYLGLF